MAVHVLHAKKPSALLGLVQALRVLKAGAWAPPRAGRWLGKDVAVRILLYDRTASRKLQQELLPLRRTNHPNVLYTYRHFYVQVGRGVA